MITSYDEEWNKKIIIDRHSKNTNAVINVDVTILVELLQYGTEPAPQKIKWETRIFIGLTMLISN